MKVLNLEFDDYTNDEYEFISKDIPNTIEGKEVTTMDQKSFYRKMAEEKGLIDIEVEVEVDGAIHFMEVENVIELIEHAPHHEQRKIKDTFSIIDFRNGDLLHYIKFLAECFIKTNVSLYV